MPPSDKLPRWIDLLAALLRHHSALTFAELASHVPAYASAGKAPDSLKRMFERDKSELRALGVPLETVTEPGEEESRYLLRTRDFYLPYLGVVSERGVQHPRTVDKYGYRSLKFLAFEPDELQAIGEAAARVLQVGDETLADSARSALRKLAFDLPLTDYGTGRRTDGSITNRPPADALVLPTASSAHPATLSELGDALFHRKRVTFSYHTMGADEAKMRTVEPYGLFFTNGHWYLTARDLEREALRNYRVSRMAQLSANRTQPDTHDYEIADGFSLRTHAASRQAWEIGDVDSYEAVVEFRALTGAAMAAAALGRVHDPHPMCRIFDVRRTDSFARWLLSFCGDAVPLSPSELVDEYAALVNSTRVLYGASREPGVSNGSTRTSTMER